jgi:hypothetical protein
MKYMQLARSWLCNGLCVALVASSCASDRGSFREDGRLPISELLRRIDAGLTNNWKEETLYRYPNSLAIRSWRTENKGPAIWILAGLHGEEPAGPNAIAASIEVFKDLDAAGIPVVLIPLANPNGYHRNWRYPNTAERDWQKGGYSVGDSEYLLPDLKDGSKPRAARSVGPEAIALTQFVLRTAKDYPPRLVLDLHEDELSRDGGYIYSQGIRADENPVGLEIIRILQQAGIPLRLAGKTRFDEPIRAGVISRDADGLPIRDGSIDELLAAPEILSSGNKLLGPSGKTVIVVETPAFSAARLAWRINAQAKVLKELPNLWKLSAQVR